MSEPTTQVSASSPERSSTPSPPAQRRACSCCLSTQSFPGSMLVFTLFSTLKAENFQLVHLGAALHDVAGWVFGGGDLWQPDLCEGRGPGAGGLQHGAPVPADGAAERAGREHGF